MALEQMLLEVVDAAIAAGDADFGNIQVVDKKTGELKIVAHRGFPDFWLEYWANQAQENGSCGSAAKIGSRIFIGDILESPFFSAEAIEIHRRAGVRAVQSTPLVAPDGALVGVFSTHYKKPQHPAVMRFSSFDRLAKLAASAIALSG